MKQSIKSKIDPIYSFLRGIASYIIPKKKGYYAFYPKLYGSVFTGNIKAFMLYLAENHKEVDPVLLSLDKEVIKGGKRHGLKTKHKVLGILWASLRAEHIFIEATTSGNYSSGKFSLIQLWHGTGFKEVALLHDITPKMRRKIELICKRYTLIVAVSESEAKKHNASFASDKSVVTGSPRNDVFFEDQKYFDELKVKYKLDQYNKIITYTPTHRDSQPSQPFTEGFYKKLQAYLEESNSVFLIKKHPGDKYFEFPDTFKNIKNMSHRFSDVQELLLITDFLISDYSSIITDFALTQKPILIYSYDFEQYIKTCRSMYYNIEEVLPQPFVTDENDLLEKLKDESWRETPEAIKSYQNFVQTFHKYLDGNSSKRLIEAIKNMSSEKK